MYSFLRSALHCFQNNSFVHCKSTKIVLTRKKKDSIFSPALIVGSSIKIEACAFGFIVIIILCLQISCGLQVWLLFWQSCQLWSAPPCRIYPPDVFVLFAFNERIKNCKATMSSCKHNKNSSGFLLVHCLDIKQCGHNLLPVSVSFADFSIDSQKQTPFQMALHPQMALNGNL